MIDSNKSYSNRLIIFSLVKLSIVYCLAFNLYKLRLDVKALSIASANELQIQVQRVSPNDYPLLHHTEMFQAVL